MLEEVRQKKMVDILANRKSVRIRELRDIFDVSEETIRRDLKKLEQDGVLKRTHGGAILVEDIQIVPPFSQRSQQHLQDKMEIAEKAVSLIDDRATIMLDSGSTTLEIARRLADRNVTVLTNDLIIAMEFSQSLQVQLIVLGGNQQKGTCSLVGPECEDTIRSYHVDFVFLGTGGIGVKQGLTTSSSAESRIKRAMIDAGNQVFCVADSSKFGQAALISYAEPKEVSSIITNRAANPEVVTQLEQGGARFIFCD